MLETGFKYIRIFFSEVKNSDFYNRLKDFKI